jgi:hypothetical protein
VSVRGRPAEVEDEIILSITIRIGEDGNVTLGRNLQAGDPVVISFGPLCDFHGVFEHEL